MSKTIYRYLMGGLLVLWLVIGSVTAVYAAGDRIQLRLKSPDSSGNIPFAVENMFPGDKETNEFHVKVSHKKPITLYYHADIRDGSEKLAEVMMVKVELPEKDIVLYDGLMRDMPSALEHQLAATEKEVLYEITAYLDTSVGNEYQFKSLVADFRWWYLEEADDSDDSNDDNNGNDDGGNSGGSTGGGSGSGGTTTGGTGPNAPEGDGSVTIVTPGEMIKPEDTQETPLEPGGISVPKTGDNSNLELYVLLFASSLTCLFLWMIWISKIRRKQEDE